MVNVITAVDIGTNNALLLIARIADGVIMPLHQEERIIRLGEGVDDQKWISDAAMSRAEEVLQDYLQISESYNSEKLLVSGTSAVRDAGNRNILLKRLQNAGINMRVLSGDEEANLTFLGALSNKQDLNGPILMIDIGGGSTEFIAGDQNDITFIKSLNIGSVRLTERFIRHDPALPQEREAVKTTTRQALAEIVPVDFRYKHFVGVAGTVTSLAAVHLQLRTYEPENIERAILTRTVVSDLIERLMHMSNAEKSLLPGLNPGRADVILAGAEILLESMIHVNAEAVQVSDRGLRFGLISDYISGGIT